MKALVSYFSAGGVTAKVAERLAKAIDAPLYEIQPEVPYTRADLNWMDRKSRSSVEMNDRNCRPALSDKEAPIEDAEVIFVGFPVWWYREPSIIDTFLESYVFSGKKIVPFATSGGSPMGDEAPERMRQIAKTEVDEGRRFPANVGNETLKEWAESFL